MKKAEELGEMLFVWWLAKDLGLFRWHHLSTIPDTLLLWVLLLVSHSHRVREFLLQRGMIWLLCQIKSLFTDTHLLRGGGAPSSYAGHLNFKPHCCSISAVLHPVINVQQNRLDQVAHSSMREKFLFNFFTGKERKKERKKKSLDCIPIHSHLPKTVNVKLIISNSRNENELRCRIIKVTDVMFLHSGL